MVLLLALISGCGKKPPPLEQPYFEKYDEAARQRIAQWKTLINDKRKAPISEKLVSVNSFFNRLHFVSDLNHWGQ
ncbi:MAG: hypothetical protein KKH60_09935, partial [Proteobacteria bacterium]|nr:hypothetical protein [Pseudomonadota bacterium]